MGFSHKSSNGFTKIIAQTCGSPLASHTDVLPQLASWKFMFQWFYTENQSGLCNTSWNLGPAVFKLSCPTFCWVWDVLSSNPHEKVLIFVADSATHHSLLQSWNPKSWSNLIVFITFAFNQGKILYTNIWHISCPSAFLVFLLNFATCHHQNN